MEHFGAVGRIAEFDACERNGVRDVACLLVADRAEEFHCCELGANFGGAGRRGEFDRRCCELDAHFGAAGRRGEFDCRDLDVNSDSAVSLAAD